MNQFDRGAIMRFLPAITIDGRHNRMKILFVAIICALATLAHSQDRQLINWQWVSPQDAATAAQIVNETGRQNYIDNQQRTLNYIFSRNLLPDGSIDWTRFYADAAAAGLGPEQIKQVTDYYAAYRKLNGGDRRSYASIIHVIRANVGDFRCIYRQHLKENPDVGGKISLKLIISPAGDVTDVSISSPNTSNDELYEEIGNRARHMRFSTVENGIDTVAYTFMLNND